MEVSEPVNIYLCVCASSQRHKARGHVGFRLRSSCEVVCLSSGFLCCQQVALGVLFLFFPCFLHQK